MNTITLDFYDIKYVERLHAYLKETFCLPDYYGCNMDALWDCLHGGFEDETTIVLKNMSAFPENRRFELCSLVRVFEDLKKVGDIADFIVVDESKQGLSVDEFFLK